MTKEEIFLDLSKLTIEEIKEVYRVLKESNQELLFVYIGCVSNGNYFKKEKYLVFCRPSSNSWTCSKDFKDRYEINLQQFKELFQEENQSSLKQVGITLEEASNAIKLNITTDLKIGQEIEVNGFILKVDREVKKWYKFKNLNSQIDYPYNFTKLSKDQLEIIDTDLQIEEIIDQDFINQLEKHSS